mgnify:CR=1 FL=1
MRTIEKNFFKNWNEFSLQKPDEKILDHLEIVQNQTKLNGELKHKNKKIELESIIVEHGSVNSNCFIVDKKLAYITDVSDIYKKDYSYFKNHIEKNNFEKKINYLLNFSSKIDEVISEKSIFDFYLAHQTNPNFSFEPKETTKKII